MKRKIMLICVFTVVNVLCFLKNIQGKDSLVFDLNNHRIIGYETTYVDNNVYDTLLVYTSITLIFEHSLNDTLKPIVLKEVNAGFTVIRNVRTNSKKDLTSCQRNEEQKYIYNKYREEILSLFDEMIFLRPSCRIESENAIGYTFVIKVVPSCFDEIKCRKWNEALFQ